MSSGESSALRWEARCDNDGWFLAERGSNRIQFCGSEVEVNAVRNVLNALSQAEPPPDHEDFEALQRRHKNRRRKAEPVPAGCWVKDCTELDGHDGDHLTPAGPVSRLQAAISGDVKKGWRQKAEPAPAGEPDVVWTGAANKGDAAFLRSLARHFVMPSPDAGNRLLDIAKAIDIEHGGDAALREECDRLQQWVNDLQAGMYINCVYCGHRYGPDSETPAVMSEVLYAHIAECREHPLSAALQALEDFGQHLGTCAIHKRTPAMIDKGEWRKCDCGFEAAFTTRPKQDTKPEEIDLMKVLVKDLKKREAEPAKVEGSAPPQGEKP